MDKEAARAARFEHDLSLLILDIDDFKQVNDTHGHLQGDEVLRAVGRILADESRGIDVPARYGGEEFVVALPETDTEGALEFAERIRAARSRRRRSRMVDGRRASCGSRRASAWRRCPGLAANVRDLIAAADAALYEAKRAGKNRVASRPADGDAGADGAPDGAPAPRRDRARRGESRPQGRALRGSPRSPDPASRGVVFR